MSHTVSCLLHGPGYDTRACHKAPVHSNKERDPKSGPLTVPNPIKTLIRMTSRSIHTYALTHRDINNPKPLYQAPNFTSQSPRIYSEPWTPEFCTCPLPHPHLAQSFSQL